MQKLINIQASLKAPKSQNNSFGGYKYRSCEDILEAVKPLLAKECLLLTVSDTVEMIGTRFYVKATATVTDGEKTFSTSAYAREEETKKGMDGAQVTGAASSYARKYALNGLFAIDDTKDADADNGNRSGGANQPNHSNHSTGQQKSSQQATQTPKGDCVCDGCGTAITEIVAHYSSDKFGRKLCMKCQGKEKKP